MTKQRPAIVTVFGVLHLIFGILFIILSIYGLIQSQMGGGMGQGFNVQEMEEAITKSFPAYKTFNLVQTVLSFVFPAVLILAGILLLRSSPTGRLVSLLYSVTSIAWTVVFIVVFLQYVRPAMEPFVTKAINEAAEKQPGGNAERQAQKQMAESMGQILSYMGACCPGILMIYPVIVFFCMFSGSMRSLGKDRNPDVLPGPEARGDDSWGRQ